MNIWTSTWCVLVVDDDENFCEDGRLAILKCTTHFENVKLFRKEQRRFSTTDFFRDVWQMCSSSEKDGRSDKKRIFHSRRVGSDHNWKSSIPAAFSRLHLYPEDTMRMQSGNAHELHPEVSIAQGARIVLHCVQCIAQFCAAREARRCTPGARFRYSSCLGRISGFPQQPNKNKVKLDEDGIDHTTTICPAPRSSRELMRRFAWYWRDGETQFTWDETPTQLVPLSCRRC